MKMDTRHSALYYLIVFLLLALPATASWASVTILGSRIIYPSTASSVDVQLKNNDAIPYIVQTWFDDGDMNTSPENSSAMPFIATPPVFRIQPKAGQVVRVIYNNTKNCRRIVNQYSGLTYYRYHQRILAATAGKIKCW